MAQPHDGLEVLATHDLAGGIARVDDDDGTRGEAIELCPVDHFMKCFYI